MRLDAMALPLGRGHAGLPRLRMRAACAYLLFTHSHITSDDRHAQSRLIYMLGAAARRTFTSRRRKWASRQRTNSDSRARYQRAPRAGADMRHGRARHATSFAAHRWLTSHAPSARR